MTPEEIARVLPYLTDSERAELDALIAASPIWSPASDNLPQQLAYASTADVVGYGGSAGGGKTELALGAALTKRHKSILIMRREATQLVGIVERIAEILGNRDGYNGTTKLWRMPDRLIELGSTPNPDDWTAYQGRPHDLLVFDEAANFLERQVRSLMGWVRSTDPNQKCQTILTTNPPTSAEGRWIVDFFAPWLQKAHPNPAKSGELRWYASVDGKEVETSPEPFDHEGQMITPMSRTFIHARVSDNRYLRDSGYVAQLQLLPEPLRSQMLFGDFGAGMEDDPYQVIPTAWVDAAVARWIDHPVKPQMDSLGVDVSRGGRDETVIISRHGMWFGRPIAIPGASATDGPSVAGQCIAAQRDGAVIHIDVIGVGASPYDFLNKARLPVIGVNVAEKSAASDRSGRLVFANLRAELWWKMREALDPVANNGIALPPHPRLRADLCAPRWEMVGSRVYIESRDEIVKRLGRSPDYGTACVLALISTPIPKRQAWWNSKHGPSPEYDPLANL